MHLHIYFRTSSVSRFFIFYHRHVNVWLSSYSHSNGFVLWNSYSTNANFSWLCHIPNYDCRDYQLCTFRAVFPKWLNGCECAVVQKSKNITSHPTHRWVSLYFKVIVAQMTFHAKLVNRRRVIHSDLWLLCVVSNAHRNVIVTAFAPDVVGHLKPWHKSTPLSNQNYAIMYYKQS